MSGLHSPSILESLAPYFEPYLTLERVNPTKTYNYSARGFFGLPVFDITLHKPKCNGGSWLYVAIPANAKLAHLAREDRLYIGSQTGDRMFRGDGLKGLNFHHAQMRAGNGDDNPVTYLNSGRRVDIVRMGELAMRRALSELPGLAKLAATLSATTQKHLGYWLEHAILAQEPKMWRWNTAAADHHAVRCINAA